MAPDFHALILEGVFYLEDGGFWCRQDTGKVVSVLGTLKPLFGQPVHFAAHHVPPNPPQMGAWGLGSCLLAPSGHCYFGHDKDPSSMLQVKGQGMLSGSGVRLLDGSMVTFQVLFMQLNAHHARLLAASAMTVEQMRDTVMSAGDTATTITDLTDRANNLAGLMETLSGMVKEPED